MDRLGAWYLEHMPAPLKPDILHNDFYLHNLMLDEKNPRQVNGVFDWEMSTLGDPMIDLGIALGYWRERVDVEIIKLAEIEPHTFKAGFLSRADMLQRYAKRTGRDVSSFPVLPVVGAMEKRDRGAADLCPLRARADQRPALCEFRAASAGARAGCCSLCLTVGLS